MRHKDFPLRQFDIRDSVFDLTVRREIRNMGAKLGSRYFPLERVLAEIAWGRERGATQLHFVEANLNLVPPFRPLMSAAADMNADSALALYAELRGEHLTDEPVTALARAGLRVAEVGLQTANPGALKIAHRVI
jgi:hypothetical protein